MDFYQRGHTDHSRQAGSYLLYSAPLDRVRHAIAEERSDYSSAECLQETVIVKNASNYALRSTQDEDQLDDAEELRTDSDSDSETQSDLEKETETETETETEKNTDTGTGIGTGTGTLAGRTTEAESLRLAMAMIEGARYASEDRARKVEQLRERIRNIGGQTPDSESDSAEDIGKRLRSLSRTQDRNLAEQLRLQVIFEDAKQYKLDGCRSMIVWMDAHLGIAKTNASEQLRVGRAMQYLPVLESLFALGQISFSQLREVTRVATAQTDSEFALATLALSVSETREYCLRFRHHTDQDEDANLAAQQGQDASDANAALRAYDRRSLSYSEPDPHTTRIVLDLPRELAEEFRRSLEQCEDWIREGGENSELHDLSDADADECTLHSDHSIPSAPGNTEHDPATLARKPTATQLRADAALLMSRRSLAFAGEAVAMADRYRVHVNIDLSEVVESFVCDDARNRSGSHSGNHTDNPSFDHADLHTDTQQGTHPRQPQNDKPICGNSDTIVERPWLHGAGPIPRATALRLAEVVGFTLLEKDNDGNIIGSVNKAPPFTKRQLKALRARDRCCAMPGCGSTRHAEGHHIVHRENGGQSTMENAVYVCGSCHRLLHEGGFRLERIGPNGVDLGQHTDTHYVDNASQARAQAKMSRVRRYRLYGSDGQEYFNMRAACAGAGTEIAIDKSKISANRASSNEPKRGTLPEGLDGNRLVE